MQWWREKALLQWHMKEQLRADCERYFRYRIIQRTQKKKKPPITIKKLRKMQKAINSLRLEAKLPRIRYVQETLDLLKQTP